MVERVVVTSVIVPRTQASVFATISPKVRASIQARAPPTRARPQAAEAKRGVIFMKLRRRKGKGRKTPRFRCVAEKGFWKEGRGCAQLVPSICTRI
jgi:hypothetical protein